MTSTGNAEYETTTTDELRALERGEANWINASVVMKVIKTTLSAPKVGKRGEFRVLNVVLCNDDESRMRLVAFSPAADKLFERIEEDALVYFTGLLVQEVFNKEDPIGPFNIEFKGVGQSDASILQHSYKVGRGMPTTPIQRIDFDKPYMRYKVSAELSSDFTPFMKGLTGQAVLVDNTGRMPVQVNILSATLGSENIFRKGRKAILKGTFRKISTITRLTIETDHDVDLPDAPSKPFFPGNAEPSASTSFSGKKPALNGLPRGSVSSAQAASTPSSTSSFGTLMRQSRSFAPVSLESVSGQIMDDFCAEDGIAWGMLEVGEDAFYEVNISSLPPDAESLLLKGAFATFRGSVDGFSVTVKGWSNVEVDGHDIFDGDDNEDEEAEDCLEESSALELRQASELSMHKFNARVLAVKQVDSQCLLTCMVIDEAKVAVKINVAAPSDDLFTLSAGTTITATGLMRFNGTFCEMNLEDSSAILPFPSDGCPQMTQPSKVAPTSRGNAALVDVKPEPTFDSSQFVKCNSRSGVADAKTLKLQQTAREALQAGGSVHAKVQQNASPQCGVVDLTGEIGAFKGTTKNHKSTVKALATPNAFHGSAGSVAVPASSLKDRERRRTAGEGGSMKSAGVLTSNQGNSVPTSAKPPKRKAPVVPLADQSPSVTSNVLEPEDEDHNPPKSKAKRSNSKSSKTKTSKKTVLAKLADQKSSTSGQIAHDTPKLPKRVLPLLPVGIAANPDRPKRESAKAVLPGTRNLVHIPNPYPDVPEAKHHFGDDSDDDAGVRPENDLADAEVHSDNDLASPSSAEIEPPSNEELPTSSGIADLEAIEVA